MVVISLVRSNGQNKCGFLRTPNRINVLLSRAKHGMYIIGNSCTSGHVPMWASVIQMLQAGDNFGNALELQCARHPEKVFPISEPDHFTVFSPEGGCNLPCEWRLSCGHSCTSKCHSKILHSAVKCLEPCPRPLKGCDHVCPNRCGDLCPRACPQQLYGLGTVLSCGHTRESLPCWQAQNPSLVFCKDRVTRTVPGCKHQVDVSCHIDVEKNSYMCTACCGTILACGHACRKNCHLCKRKQDGNVVEESHGTCEQICDRRYNTCNHRCRAKCHGKEDCPPCQAPCEVSCCHSKCTKQCHEPCTPCAEDTCSSTCPHSSCSLPCAAPCDWLPCSRRCSKTLECGHQCPSLCGEMCPPSKYCQICAPDNIKHMVVDLIQLEEYQEINLNDKPCIVPPCGHLLTVETMDGQMEFSKYYNTEADGAIVGMTDLSAPFSMDEMKTCSICRGPLRTVSRYGRIVRRGLIDESTKKFIVSANGGFLPLYELVHQRREQLAESVKSAQDGAIKPGEKDIVLVGRRQEQLKTIYGATHNRYSRISGTRRKISEYLRRVDIQEQPFKRVWDMVQFARKRERTCSNVAFDATVLQTNQTLRATALLLRCDIVVLSDFLAISEPRLKKLDFGANREDCSTLVTAAQEAKQPVIEVEAHIFYIQLCAAERRYGGSPEIADKLSAEATEHLTEAEQLCQRYPAQTGRLVGEVKAVRKMLESETFMATVTDQEWKEVMTAMAGEFRGSGHWYTCVNGHAFTVGECGMPMQEARCNQCGAPIGGRHHQPAEGVERATELEQQLAEMQLG